MNFAVDFRTRPLVLVANCNNVPYESGARAERKRKTVGPGGPQAFPTLRLWRLLGLENRHVYC